MFIGDIRLPSLFPMFQQILVRDLRELGFGGRIV